MAGAIPAGEKLGWGLGKVEEVLGKMLAQGIEVWWPEEGDRREGATVERADELHSSLIDGMRRKEEMSTETHNQKNIWMLSGWTVRRSRADRPKFPRCYTYGRGEGRGLDEEAASGKANSLLNLRYSTTDQPTEHTCGPAAGTKLLDL